MGGRGGAEQDVAGERGAVDVEGAGGLVDVGVMGVGRRATSAGSASASARGAGGATTQPVAAVTKAIIARMQGIDRDSSPPHLGLGRDR